MKLTPTQVRANLAQIANRDHYDFDFIYNLMLAYGRSKTTIKKLRAGDYNRSDDPNEVIMRNEIYYKVFPAGTELMSAVDQMASSDEAKNHRVRYIIATDLVRMAAFEAKTGKCIEIKLADIDEGSNPEFFYDWIGRRVVDSAEETEADRNAAEKMNQLYSEIERCNIDRIQNEPGFRHGLNVFFTRLLFCYFAEDTGIFKSEEFKNNLFSHYLKLQTEADGTGVDEFLNKLFVALDTPDAKKDELGYPYDQFPYVNGTVFDCERHDFTVPKFNANARRLLLELSKSDWTNINPDIFGTIFQGIVDPDKRSENGMDYTSVPNIMKVIEPLFLNMLYDEFRAYQDKEGKLFELLERICKIKIFDPACGSGNFLIIAFKQLRNLQYQILERINELRGGTLTGNQLNESFLIRIENFYGIEIDDFAHELAVLSMHIAHQQMNMEFDKEFGVSSPIIPLTDAPHIVCANAAKINWQDVCPNKPTTIVRDPNQFSQGSLIDDGAVANTTQQTVIKQYDEIYLIGNPPYKGAKLQTPDQKADFAKYFGDEPYSKSMDYIALWFIKGARYISGTRAQLAFVSTNSVCQGEHVAVMFPKIYDCNVEIGFAYTSFKWKNSARDNAGVTVIILSLRSVSGGKKWLYVRDLAQVVDNINPYLAPGADMYIVKSSKSISMLPPMNFGSQPIDGGNLMLSDDERAIVCEYNDGQYRHMVRRVVGSYELIHSVRRYCLWVTAKDYTVHLPQIILDKINKTKEFRNKTKSASSRKGALTPWAFNSIRYDNKRSLVIPRVSSETRQFIPMKFVDGDTVVLDSALFIEDAQPWLFALLESKMHMVWIRTVCGKLETRIRYSSTLGYNTFPVPPLTDLMKQKLDESGLNILLAREDYPDKTLAELYNPDKMPDSLRQAHIDNDRLVDSLYKTTPFKSDEERLSRLFAMYEQMTKENS